jgi:hypothetical protein
MLPQLTQNLLPSGLSNPQLGHFSSPALGRSGPLRLTPHSPQNFWLSGFLNPQLGHFVAIPPIPSNLCYFFLLGLPFRCFSIRSSILRFLLLGNLSWVIAPPPSPECPFFPMLFAGTLWMLSPGCVSDVRGRRLPIVARTSFALRFAHGAGEWRAGTRAERNHMVGR